MNNLNARHLTLVLFIACTKPNEAVPDAGVVALKAKLKSIGPRVVSNATSTPLSLYGERFKTGMGLELGATKLQLFALDDTHAFVRLPAGAPGRAEVKLDGLPTGQFLEVVDDTSFPVLGGLVVNGGTAYVGSSTEDVVYAIDLQSKAVSRIDVADGPSALVPWRDGVVVTHRYAPKLVIISPDGGTRELPGPLEAISAVASGDTLYVGEAARDSISALDLSAGAKEMWRSPVAPNPGALALTDGGLAVGSEQTGEIEWLDVSDGHALAKTEPRPGITIAGPTTIGLYSNDMGRWVMNGTRVRALAAGPKQLFVATVGPNVGPNEKKMEVSMNGGVGVVADGGWLLHYGFGAGLTQALALGDGLIYAADIGLGLIRVVDAKALTGKDPTKSLLQEVAIPPPAGFPLIRPEEDFAVKGRAGTSLHSGPAALALSSDKKTLYALDRFTGTLARIDVSKASAKKAALIDQLPITDMLKQASRRRGEVLYYCDLGRTAVTCDACHPDGHTGGVLFEKTHPLRIYRSTTVRGAIATPPYFTPASTFSIGQTNKFVMERNRYGNPVPTLEELEDITRYGSAIVTLPNPFADENGAPPLELTLPDGRASHPRAGLALFEGKAKCSGCHPGPHFTTDQDPDTRGKYLDVGTPHHLPLRLEMQSPIFKGFAPPALLGAWDTFPMLSTGAAGLAVQEDRVVVDTRFPLRKAVADFAPKHGRANLLTPAELDDLLGYVQSL